MDILRVGLIYLVVGLFAGAIAYLGNQLGRQIGRRKMSVLNLRPRHTSILITSLTGALIALVTLTLFAFLSEPVRQLLTGVERLRQEEEALKNKIAALSQALEEGAIVWKVDEKVAHVTLPPYLTRDQVRSNLMGLLAEVNANTILRNNRIAREKGEAQLTDDVILVDHDPAQLDQMSGELAGRPETMGVRVLADRNTLYRDRVRVRLEPWEVRRVFREDEEVARRRINPNDPELLSQFLKFVEDTRQSALSRGMLPVGGDFGGGLTEEQFETLIQQIKSQSGPSELVAVANRDLYETNSLDIRIEVHSRGGPAPLRGSL